MWYNNLTMRNDLLPLARALVRTEAFQQNPHLTLYCGVPLESVVTKGHSPPSLGPESQHFDYVLCDHNVPVLTVTLVPWNEWDECPENCRSGSEALQLPSLPGVPSLAFPGDDLEQAQLILVEALDKVGDPSRIELQFIGQAVASSPQLERELIAAKMLRYIPFHDGISSKQRQSQKCGQEVPTQYGWECGLMLGFSACGDRTYECGAYYAPSAPAFCRAMERQSGCTGRNGQQWRETIPLEQCISRLQQGLPSDSAYSVLQVRKMADMPLNVYLQDFPGDLAELRRALPELEEDAVYRDAAVLIHRKSGQSTWEEEPGLSTEYSWCTQILAKPLLQVCQELRRARQG